MRPIQTPPPAAGASSSSSPSNRKGPRRRPDLTLPLPQRDPALAVPLPLPPTSAPSSISTSSSAQPSKQLNFTKLECINRIGSGSGGTVYKVIHQYQYQLHHVSTYNKREKTSLAFKSPTHSLNALEKIPSHFWNALEICLDYNKGPNAFHKCVRNFGQCIC